MTTAEKMLQTEQILSHHFIERDEEIHGLSLAAISNTNMLLLGPPGTGKTYLVNSWAQLIKKNAHFSWLLHKFLTPDELFGPVSLKGLKDEKFKRNTTGKLPEATTCFLDEIYKCNAGSLNALLSLLNEKVFFNDGEAINTPLVMAIGASNELPEESDNLEALDDRFPLRYHVYPIQEAVNKMKLLDISTKIDEEPVLSLDDIKKARVESSNISISEDVVDHLITLIDCLRAEGITITDRTFRQAKFLLQAEAYTKGLEIVSTDELEILKNVLWRQPEHIKIVHSHILRLINPEKDKIRSLYDDAEEIFENAMALVKSKDTTKAAKEGIEIADKLKSAKREIDENIKIMKTKGKNIKESVKMKKQVEVWLEKVFSQLCGVDFGFPDKI
jgi:MoxR-like ATPase